MAQKQFIIDGGFKTNANSEIAGNLTVTGVITGDGSGLTGVISYVSEDFGVDFATKTTDDLAEGSNLYFTDARALTAVESAIATATTDMATTAFVNEVVDGQIFNEVIARDAAIATATTDMATTAFVNEVVDGQIFNEVIARDAAIATAVSGIINGAPGALDTLNELAAALGDDSNFAATITNALAAAVTRIEALEAKLALVTSVSGGIRVDGTVTATGDVTAFGA